MDIALLVDLIVKAAIVGLALVPLVWRDASHFAGKAMGFRAVLYPLAVLVIPPIWMVAGRPEPYPFLADVALGVPFAVDAGANVFGLFAIRRFDVVTHAVGWFFLSIAFGLAVAPLVDERWILFGLVLGFGAVVDVLWEAGEFLLMRSGASGLELTYENTIQDLVVSLSGAALAAVVMTSLLWPVAGTPRTLFGWNT